MRTQYVDKKVWFTLGNTTITYIKGGMFFAHVHALPPVPPAGCIEFPNPRYRAAMLARRTEEMQAIGAI